MQIIHQGTIAAAILFATPAWAQDGPIVVEGGEPSAAVSYADLNIHSAAGLRTLEGRVGRAASRLCVAGGRRPLETEMFEQRCVNSAVADAREQIRQLLSDRTVRTASRSTLRIAAR